MDEIGAELRVRCKHCGTEEPYPGSLFCSCGSSSWEYIAIGPEVLSGSIEPVEEVWPKVRCTGCGYKMWQKESTGICPECGGDEWDVLYDVDVVVAKPVESVTMTISSKPEPSEPPDKPGPKKVPGDLDLVDADGPLSQEPEEVVASIKSALKAKLQGANASDFTDAIMENLHTEMQAQADKKILGELEKLEKEIAEPSKGSNLAAKLPWSPPSVSTLVAETLKSKPGPSNEQPLILLGPTPPIFPNHYVNAADVNSVKVSNSAGTEKVEALDPETVKVMAKEFKFADDPSAPKIVPFPFQFEGTPTLNVTKVECPSCSYFEEPPISKSACPHCNQGWHYICEDLHNPPPNFAAVEIKGFDPNITFVSAPQPQWCPHCGWQGTTNAPVCAECSHDLMPGKPEVEVKTPCVGGCGEDAPQGHEMCHACTEGALVLTQKRLTASKLHNDTLKKEASNLRKKNTMLEVSTKRGVDIERLDKAVSVVVEGAVKEAHQELFQFGTSLIDLADAQDKIMSLVNAGLKMIIVPYEDPNCTEALGEDWEP